MLICSCLNNILYNINIMSHTTAIRGTRIFFYNGSPSTQSNGKVNQKISDREFFIPDECGAFYIIYRLISTRRFFFSVSISMIRNLESSLSRQVYLLQVNFDLFLDRLDTFSSPYLLVFKLESLPRCSRIFHSVMTNSFVGLYFHFIPSSSVLSTTSPQQFTILIMTN